MTQKAFYDTSIVAEDLSCIHTNRQGGPLLTHAPPCTPVNVVETVMVCCYENMKSQKGDKNRQTTQIKQTRIQYL